jgi:hypothetical protein
MKKRYNDGGLPDYEREPDAEDKAQQNAAVAEYKVEKGMNPNLNADMTFKEAFAAARKEGDKTFEWRGKKYTTELAPSKPKPKAPEKRKPLPGRATEGKMSDVVGAKKGGMVSSASKRGDGCAIKGKTRGRMV